MAPASPPRVADLDLGELLPSADFLLEDFENFNPRPTLFGPGVIVASIGSYAVEGEDGANKLEEKIREWAATAEDGKFNKTDALYSPIAPPPGAWDYRCRNCRFYMEGNGPKKKGKCAIVGHEEDPFGGASISPEAWCAVWLPESGDEWFTYIARRAEGGDT